MEEKEGQPTNTKQLTILTVAYVVVEEKPKVNQKTYKHFSY